MRSCASSPGCSATRTARSRSRSARRSRGPLSTPTTRARSTGAGTPFRTCSCPATTRVSASGGWSAAASAAEVSPRHLRYHCASRATLSPVAFFVPMSGVIDSIERAQLRRVPSFQAGDRVRVHFQVVEGTRRRTQVFEGIVIKRQGSGVRETFTVRKQSFGVGVERTFPVHSPKIERIEVAARGDVRRAKLYYLRGRVGKRARVRERRYTGGAQEQAYVEGAMPPDDV